MKDLSESARAGLFARWADYWTGAYRKVAVSQYTIETPKFAADVSLKIAVVSDLHADTRFMPLERITEIVETANRLDADLIHLGGDLSAQNNFAMTPLPLEMTVEALSRLRAPLGVVAVTGNHDWWDDIDTQRGGMKRPKAVELLRSAGISVLTNDATALDHPSGVWVAGIDSQMAFERSRGRHEGAHDLDAAFAQVPDRAPTVLLAHEPDIFAEFGQGKTADLVLSGHTHGGQIRVFGRRPVVPSKYGSRYAYGQYHENGRDLIVSGGLGCSKFPLRFGVLPEIVLVTLRGKT